MSEIPPSIPALSRLSLHFAAVPAVPLSHHSSDHHFLFLCCPTLSSHGLHTRLCVGSLVGHLDGRGSLLTLPGMSVKLQSVATSCSIFLATLLSNNNKSFMLALALLGHTSQLQSLTVVHWEVSLQLGG